MFFSVSNRKVYFTAVLAWWIMAVLGACSKVPPSMQWQPRGTATDYRSQLQTGDILIKNKQLPPMSWFGHAAVVVEPSIVGDYPKIGVGYDELSVTSWLAQSNEIIVLRYSQFDNQFAALFWKNLQAAKNKPYRVVAKTQNQAFYCSQFVWYVYWKTASELGYDLDLDSDGGAFVLPYDLLNSTLLRQVLLEEH